MHPRSVGLGGRALVRHRLVETTARVTAGGAFPSSSQTCARILYGTSLRVAHCSLGAKRVLDRAASPPFKGRDGQVRWTHGSLRQRGWRLGASTSSRTSHGDTSHRLNDLHSSDTLRPQGGWALVSMNCILPRLHYKIKKATVLSRTHVLAEGGSFDLPWHHVRGCSNLGRPAAGTPAIRIQFATDSKQCSTGTAALFA